MRDKIRKLLTLANDAGATEGEKNSALEMAQALMLKYNISVDLDEKDVKIMAGGVYGKQYTFSWHKLVAMSVSEMYTCKLVTWSKGFQFVGFPENIEACQMTLDFIVEQIDDAWKVHLNKAKEIAKREGHEGEVLGKQYRDNFRYGCAAKVWGRIHKMMEDLQTNNTKAMETVGCTSLVVVDTIKKQLDDISAFMDATMNLRNTRAMQLYKDGKGHGAGCAAGDHIQINRQVVQKRLQIESKGGNK